MTIGPKIPCITVSFTREVMKNSAFSIRPISLVNLQLSINFPWLKLLTTCVAVSLKLKLYKLNEQKIQPVITIWRATLVIYNDCYCWGVRNLLFSKECACFCSNIFIFYGQAFNKKTVSRGHCSYLFSQSRHIDLLLDISLPMLA